MTIRETSRLGSLIVRRLEKHGKLREKWCPERLEKPTETIGHREPAQTSERYFWRLQQDIIVFNLEDLQLCSEDSSCQENPPKRHRSRLCPQSVSLSKIGIIGHCADLSMIQSDEARTFLFRLGPLYVQNQSDSRQFSTRPSWQKHSSSRRVRR